MTAATPIAGADEEFGGLSFKVKRLGEYNPGESWVLLYYGASKAGKTFFAGTAGPRTLFLNIGNGIETLLAPAFANRFPDARREMIMVDVRELANTMVEAFDKTCDIIDESLKKIPDKFDTIVLDEATAFRDFAMTKAMTFNNDQSKGGRRARGNREEGWTKIDVDDYGIEMDMVKWFLATYVPIFKEAGKHFIMLAHERHTYKKGERIGDEAVLVRVAPGFTGKTFVDQVPAFFDDVWHAEKVSSGSNAVYRARTAGDDALIAGARHGGIFETVESNPNFLDMLERIRKSQALKRK